MAGSTTQADALAPISGAARISALDILRGISVLGILMMNITGFALLREAYSNPLVDGGATGINLTSFTLINVGFEGTMRGIFSLLFGASIVLLPERMEQAGAGLMAAEIHFRRMLWMMLFGVIHWALLLWYGEILFAYSMCGLLLFALRKMAPGRQLAIALALLITAAALSYSHYNHLAGMADAAQQASSAKAAGQPLSEAQTDAIAAWEDHSNSLPSPEDVAQERAWHSGSYWQAVSGQFDSSYEFQWTESPFWLFFDMIPFMLIGMALLKWRVLSAGRSGRFYLAMLLAGYGIGIPLGLYEVGLMLDGNFSTLATVKADTTYELSRLAMVVGHLGLFLSFIRTGWLGWLQRALAATGQMALTNYLMQTIICTALFYGFGFGLFEAFERHQLYYVVAAIWLAELAWSPLWLRYFRFGPFEWLWRSLTYWRPQPMRVG